MRERLDGPLLRAQFCWRLARLYDKRLGDDGKNRHIKPPRAAALVIRLFVDQLIAKRSGRAIACQKLHFSRRALQQLYQFSDARFARLYVVLRARWLEPF